MQSSSWEILQTKRRRKSLAPPVSKRRRLHDSDDVSTSTSSKGKNDKVCKGKRQSTLTQIDFVQTSTPRPEYSNEELDILISPSRPATTGTKTRNSTLTQMDFLESIDVGAQTAAEWNDKENRLWLDGISEKDFGASPTMSKRRRSRSTVPRKALVEDHGFQPMKRSRVENDTRPDTSRQANRRKTRATVGTGKATPAPPPPLVIRDSADFLEPAMPQQNLAPAGNVPDLPSTPLRKRGEVLSSQSPESIKPISKVQSPRRLRRPSHKETPAEPPLHSSKAPLGTSPKRKICVLKLPRVGMLPISKKEQDSQFDIWSLQATSSPKRSEMKPKMKSTANSISPKIVAEKEVKVDLEHSNKSKNSTIPTVSNLSAQDSLPDLADMFGSAAPPQLPDDVMLLDNEPLIVASNASEHANDRNLDHSYDDGNDPSDHDDDDLGPAVANDTQFIAGLVERVSSPSSRITCASTAYLIKTPSRRPAQSDAKDIPNTQALADDTPLPTPKLIQPTSARHSTRKRNGVTSLNHNAPPLIDENTNRSTSTTTIPLNDTASSTQPSSPPLLLPQSKSSQQIVRPASLPHPSQISTQAPSQGYLPLSSAIPTQPQLTKTPLEHFSIKDTSSPHLLSGSLRGQDQAFSEVEDTDDEGFDLEATPISHSNKWHVKEEDLVSEDATQTPTQRSKRTSQSRQLPVEPTQESPVILKATTRSQRDRELEVVSLLSSPLSQQRRPPKRRRSPDHLPVDFSSTPSPSPVRRRPHPEKSESKSGKSVSRYNSDKRGFRDCEEPSSPIDTSPARPDISHKYPPIEGFNNETQSDYTQGGHITAAFVHRCWEDGTVPRSFVPKPYRAGVGK